MERKPVFVSVGQRDGLRNEVSCNTRLYRGDDAICEMCATDFENGEPVDAKYIPALKHAYAIGMLQYHGELIGLLKELESDPPRVIVEIGVFQGGTTTVWSDVFPDTAIIGVDNWSLPGRIPGFGKESNVCLVNGDSHSNETLKRVEGALRGRLIDFLFIDGGHSYEDVKRDFELYTPLVRKGGVIALHDIRSNYHVGVRKFWGEIVKSKSHRTKEYVTPKAIPCGIGIVWRD